jgi:hypothetical protein
MIISPLLPELAFGGCAGGALLGAIAGNAGLGAAIGGAVGLTVRQTKGVRTGRLQTRLPAGQTESFKIPKRADESGRISPGPFRFALNPHHLSPGIASLPPRNELVRWRGGFQVGEETGTEGRASCSSWGRLNRIMPLSIDTEAKKGRK